MRSPLAVLGLFLMAIPLSSTSLFARTPAPGDSEEGQLEYRAQAQDTILASDYSYANYSALYAGYGNQRVAITDEHCCSCGSCECCCDEGLLPCFKKDACGFFLDGWVSGGVLSNDCPPLTTSAPAGPLSLNDGANNAQLNQVYLTLGREAIRGHRMSVGGRVDLLYGADYLYTSALGLEVFNYNDSGQPVETVYAAKPRWNRNGRGGFPEYGLAMPQAYGEVYLPFLAGTSIKLGHMYSPVGYESVMTPSNFFYTHTYSMLYGEPQTVTGVMVDQKLNNNWSLLAGFTEGWNIWDDPNDELNITGGVKWQNDSRTSSVALTVMTGDEQVETNGRTTNYSLIYQQKLNPVLTWVFQHDLGVAENGAYEILSDQSIRRLNGNWYSIVNYLYWQVTDTVALGGRFEWFQDRNHSRVVSQAVHTDIGLPGYGYGFTGKNYFDLSLGLNWKPTNWITIRPEVRYDWSDVEYAFDNGEVILPGAYDNYTKKDLFTVGGDMIVRF
ncbi:MAG: outer membrane beta-barrel protein [Planctomycetia bacterium]|nr:outer membrane beta-barrel protein [Planctomycetia bacterium]